MNGEWVTELSPADPPRATGEILRETEEFVLGRGGIVARLAGVYGPGRSALLRTFLEGTAVLDPSADRFINLGHREDIAAALLLLAEQPARAMTEREEERRIYNVSDGHPTTLRDCYEWLAAHLHRPLPPMVASLVERKRGATNKRISSAKLQAIGWSPRYPTFEEGMLRSILPAAGL
jgi:nucleoside-diphosphate-sugar epimerase